MIELGDTEEEYEVSIIVTVPVKRLVRVRATSESHAREVARRQIISEVDRGEDHSWSIPSMSRHEVETDQELLGPSIVIHHSNVGSSSVVMTGMAPTRI